MLFNKLLDVVLGRSHCTMALLHHTEKMENISIYLLLLYEITECSALVYTGMHYFIRIGFHQTL